MRFRTVENYGEIGIEFFNNNSERARVSREFLKKLIFNVVRRATKYYVTTGIQGDHIFSYSEKQFHSVVCPSIADITSSYVIENPLERKRHGKKEYLGHADYWIKYKKYCFLMELKHAYFAFRRPDSPRANIAKRFGKALDQLKSAKKDSCETLTLNKGLIKIALEAIVFYEGSSKRLSIDSIENLDFTDLFKKLIENMKPKHRLDMQALWILDSKLSEPYEYSSEWFKIYPAVAFIANIS